MKFSSLLSSQRVAIYLLALISIAALLVMQHCTDKSPSSDDEQYWQQVARSQAEEHQQEMAKADSIRQAKAEAKAHKSDSIRTARAAKKASKKSGKKSGKQSPSAPPRDHTREPISTH